MRPRRCAPPLSARAPLLLVLVCAACGRGAGEGGPALVRAIDLQPAGQAQARVEPVLTALPIPENGGDWRIEAALVDFGEPDGLDGFELRMVGKKAKRVIIPGSFAAGAFNRVAVEFVAFDSTLLRASLRRDGEAVVTSGPGQAPPIPGAQTVLLDLPQVRSQRGVFDELEINVQGPGACVVRRITLVSQPLEAWLPEPGGEAIHVAISGEARLARGLSSSLGLRATIEAPPGAKLCYSYGVPRLLKHPGEALAELVVSATTADGEQVRATHPLDDPVSWPQWHSAELDLAPLGGRPAELHFEVRSPDPTLAVAVVGEVQLRVRGSAPPTVLLITSDTHRADYVGWAEGGAQVRTPVLDELAARGARFVDCFSATNITNPSHMTLMTAVHPRDTGILVNNRALSRAATTLAESFAAGGYATLAVVSTRHLGDDVSGLGQGFGRMSWPTGGALDVVDGVGVLEGWLPEYEDLPLFVWLHLFDAHGPYDPPEPYRNEYYRGTGDPFDPALPASPDLPLEHLPDHLEGLKDPAWPEAMYRGEISYLDAELARVLERERFRRGWVAFTADHGECLGQHGIYYEHADVFPDTIHVPLVIAGPGVPSGLRVDRPVRNPDVGRTLLDLAGLEELPFGGANLLSSGDDPAAAGPRFTIAGNRTSASITHRDLHLILHLKRHDERIRTEAADLHQVELYDLEADPGCEVELQGARPQEAARLRATLVGWLTDREELGWAGAESTDGSLVAGLAELGYTTGGGEGSEDFIDPECDCAWCERFR